MSLRFTKMNGLGNDFIVIDAIHQDICLNPTQIAALSNRHTGIGFDQCLLVEKSQQPDVDFFYRIFNANGKEVGQCGNGARCLARFVAYYGLTDKKEILIATKTTQMHLKLNADNTVTVDMGIPQWSPNKIPLLAHEEAATYALPLINESTNKPEITQHIHSVSVGNPHAVTVVSNIASIDIHNLGKAISEHALFPEQCNASFMQILNPEHIKLRVYERGCAETLACGSAAVAAVAVGRRFYQLESHVTVSLPGGDLIVEWANQESTIQLTGPASFVYEGALHPCAL